MATLKIDKLLKQLDVEELEAAKAAKAAELAIIDEALEFRRRIGELAGASSQRDSPRGAGTADRAHAWLLQHGPASAKDVGQAIGVTRAAVYQAMKKATDRFKSTAKGWTARKPK